MLSTVLKKELLGFFGLVMGCFFSCFRVRPDDLVSKTREPVVYLNRLSSLLQSEEDKEDSGFSMPEEINVGKILKDEARFLKAHGTMSQTPVEIQNVTERYEGVSHSSEGSEHFRFHSWLLNTSIESLNVEKQPNQPPAPIKLGEGWVNGEEPLEHSPSRFCMSCNMFPNSSPQANEDGSVTDKTSSTRTHLSTAVAASGQCKNKSVHFEFEDDMASFSSTSSSSGTGGLYSKQCVSGGAYSVSKHSPYTTPLKLTDEMQTPGTVFPANLDGVANGRNPQIRSQYVYSVLNPVENIFQHNLLKEEKDSFENAESVNLKGEVKIRKASAEQELGVESLSSWLKPPTNKEGKKNFGQTLMEMEFQTLHDQKVSWHATPFKERLEKVSSDESSITPRYALFLRHAILSDSIRVRGLVLYYS